MTVSFTPSDAVSRTDNVSIGGYSAPSYHSISQKQPEFRLEMKDPPTSPLQTTQNITTHTIVWVTSSSETGLGLITDVGDSALTIQMDSGTHRFITSSGETWRITKPYVDSGISYVNVDERQIEKEDLLKNAEVINVTIDYTITPIPDSTIANVFDTNEQIALNL